MAYDYDNSYRDYYNTSTRKGGYSNRNDSRSKRTNWNHSTKANTTWLWLIGGLVALWTAAPFLKLIKNLGNKLGSGLEASQETQELIQAQQDQIMIDVYATINHANLHHPDSYYVGLANDQFDQMNGINWTGWIPTEFFENLEALNGDELRAVYCAFNFRAPDAWYASANAKKEDLIEWYKGDLSSFSLWGTSPLDRMKNIWSFSGLPW